MHLELGLNEEDEYIRLQELNQGIKEIAHTISTKTEYEDSYSLKLLICSYPFESNSVELLLSIILDRFQNQKFVKAFHLAISEVAMQQEPKESTSFGSSSISSPKENKKHNQSTDKIKNIQNISFSNEVTQKILVAKEFASSYLKQVFILAKNLNMNLEQLAKVFKTFVMNTKSQDFRIKIVQIFEECKSEIFEHSEWVELCYEEINLYLFKSQISYPTFIPDMILENKPSKVSSSYLNSSSDYEDNQEENFNNIIQQWLCETETFDVQELSNILNQVDNFEELIKFITFPEKKELAECWADQFQNFQLQCNENNTFHKFIDSCLKSEETIRSYKALQVLIKAENQQFFHENIPQNLILIYQNLYECINDQIHNVNINHVTTLIDHTLLRHPKQCLVQIIDLNLFFSLSMYLYNDMVKVLFENLINLRIDKYKLGCFFQEQLWKYLCKTDWFQFISKIIFKEDVDWSMTNKQMKCDTKNSILSVLRTLSQYENQQIQEEIDTNQKEKLTNLLGILQAGKTPLQFYKINQFNWQTNFEIQEYINFEEIDNKDFDNLKHFIDERKHNYHLKQPFQDIRIIKQKEIQQNTEQQQKQQESTVDSKFTTPNQFKQDYFIVSTRKNQKSSQRIFRQNTQQYISEAQPTKRIQRVNTIDDNSPGSFRKQFQCKSLKSINTSTTSQKTEKFQINDGFSSSKLKTIYPSYKTSIQNIDYEKQLKHLEFDEKYINNGLALLHFSTTTIVEFLKQNDEKLKQFLYRVDITVLCKCFLRAELFEKYFQIYLFDFLDNHTFHFNVSEDCGIFINHILQSVTQIKQLIECRKGLTHCFMNACEYICRIIFDMHKNQVTNKHQFKKTLLMTTMNLGFQLVYYEQFDQMEKFFVKYLNESVLHIMIVWFFECEQNNSFQRNFFIFLYLFLNTAQQSCISTLFFQIGFISSLQNAYSKFCINGIRSDSVYGNLCFYMQIMVQIIEDVMHKRQFIQLRRNLESMESWHILKNSKINPKPKLLIDINTQFQFQDQFLDDIESFSIVFDNQNNFCSHEEHQFIEKKYIEKIFNKRKTQMQPSKLVPINSDKTAKQICQNLNK